MKIEHPNFCELQISLHKKYEMKINKMVLESMLIELIDLGEVHVEKYLKVHLELPD